VVDELVTNAAAPGGARVAHAHLEVLERHVLDGEVRAHRGRQQDEVDARVEDLPFVVGRERLAVLALLREGLAVVYQRRERAHGRVALEAGLRREVALGRDVGRLEGRERGRAARSGGDEDRP
jgi:hypothetical protein